MAADGKIAITRVELVLITLLVMLGFGVWLAVDQLVGGGLTWLQSSESRYQTDQQVPLRSAELSRVQNVINAHLDQIDRQRQERDAQYDLLQQMCEAYQGLPPPEEITQTKALTMPIETLRSYFTAREQHSVAQEMVTALGTQLDILVRNTLSISDGLAVSGLGRTELMTMQARL